MTTVLPTANKAKLVEAKQWVELYRSKKRLPGGRRKQMNQCVKFLLDPALAVPDEVREWMVRDRLLKNYSDRRTLYTKPSYLTVIGQTVVFLLGNPGFVLDAPDLDRMVSDRNRMGEAKWWLTQYEGRASLTAEEQERYETEAEYLLDPYTRLPDRVRSWLIEDRLLTNFSQGTKGTTTSYGNLTVVGKIVVYRLKNPGVRLEELDRVSAREGQPNDLYLFLRQGRRHRSLMEAQSFIKRYDRRSGLLAAEQKDLDSMVHFLLSPEETIPERIMARLVEDRLVSSKENIRSATESAVTLAGRLVIAHITGDSAGSGRLSDDTIVEVTGFNRVKRTVPDPDHKPKPVFRVKHPRRLLAEALDDAEGWLYTFVRRHSEPRKERELLDKIAACLQDPDVRLSRRVAERMIADRLIRGSERGLPDRVGDRLTPKGSLLAGHLASDHPSRPNIDIRVGLPKQPDDRKRCSKCKVLRPARDYGKQLRSDHQRKHPDHRLSVCNRCRSRSVSSIKGTRSRPNDWYDHVKYKRCGCNFHFGCGNKEKPRDHFKKNSSSRDGLASYCRPCTRAYKSWFRKLKGKPPEPGATSGMAANPEVMDCANCDKPFLQWRKSQMFCDKECHTMAMRSPVVNLRGFPHIRCLSCRRLKFEYREFRDDRDFNYCIACEKDPTVNTSGAPDSTPS